MNNANYMDGVPVKIAEKYKPPPLIYTLPQSLTNKINLEQNYYWTCPTFAYDIQLEKKALTKIEQWKRIRQRDKELRKERISRREEQRKREDEDRQKNLLYNVSYPSTDDLSSGNEEEENELNRRTNENEAGGTFRTKESAPQISITETAANSFHNILQPTVLSYNSSNTNNVSNGSNCKTHSTKTSCDGKLSNSFNYKDFECDTSSPFDNIELKTINDLAVLAQVLHNTQVKSPMDEKLSDNSAADLVINSKIEEEPELSNSYGIPIVNNEDIPKTNNLPRFENYTYNSTQVTSNTELRDQHTTPINAMHYSVNLNAPPLTPQHQYYNGLCKTNDGLNTCQSNVASPLPYNRLKDVTDEQLIKSKSVPDIIKELRDEVRNSEIRRNRNYSYNKEDESLISAKECSINEWSNEITAVKDEISDIFMDLDDNGKKLVDQISAMGFPKKRVVRIVNLVGVDDKKVIEHLIPLSELADLGFEEYKISKALIRNENNKNKALDELIS